ncbi:MAG: UvrB/UvrC motif-containing protein [Acutalibacteraceae bacterium]
MLCENCSGREATTHIKKVENGHTTQMHLCSECAKSLGYGDLLGDFGFSLRDLFSNLFGDSALMLGDKTERCEKCGSSFNDIVKSGYVGCSECYRKFYDKLLPSIQRIHGKALHNGKKPVNIVDSSERPTKESLIERLSKQMEEAVQSQNFEEAAALRDKINSLKEGD